MTLFSCLGEKQFQISSVFEVTDSDGVEYSTPGYKYEYEYR